MKLKYFFNAFVDDKHHCIKIMKLNRKFDNEINNNNIVQQRRCRNRHLFFVKFVFFNLIKLINETMF